MTNNQENFEDSKQKEKTINEFLSDAIESARIECPKLSITKNDSRTIPSVDIYVDPSADESEEFEKLKKIFDSNNLELGSLVGQGGRYFEFLIHQKRIDGKINWRRWVHYPDAISQEAKTILDKIVAFSDGVALFAEQNGSDSYDKFCRLYEEAYKRGIIVKEERDCVNRELYRAAHGGN